MPNAKRFAALSKFVAGAQGFRLIKRDVAAYMRQAPPVDQVSLFCVPIPAHF